MNLADSEAELREYAADCNVPPHVVTAALDLLAEIGRRGLPVPEAMTDDEERSAGWYWGALADGLGASISFYPNGQIGCATNKRAIPIIAPDGSLSFEPLFAVLTTGPVGK